MTQAGDAIPTKIYSPLRADLLLHCAISAEAVPLNPDAPAVREELDDLVQLGAIEATGTGPNLYRATPLGRAWVAAICNVKIPRMVFLDEAGKELVIR